MADQRDDLLREALLIQAQQIQKNKMQQPELSQNDKQAILDDVGMPQERSIIGKIGAAVDSVTGAPTRAAIGAALNKQNPITAGFSQLGENPDNAPTGKQLAQQMGISEKPMFDPATAAKMQAQAELPGRADAGSAQGLMNLMANTSRSGAVGLGIDIAADPTNIIPAVEAAKFLGKGAMGVGKGVAGLGKLTTRGAGLAENALVGTNAINKTADVVGTVAHTAADATKGTYKSIATAFTPKVAEDFPRLAATAEKHGIDPSLLPDSFEFGQHSMISRAQRAKAEGPMGQAELEKWHEGYGQVQNALETKLTSISNGAPRAASDMGAAIQANYNKNVENFFNQMDITHDSVMKMAPGLPISPKRIGEVESKLAGIEKFAKGRVIRGIGTQKAEAAELLNVVQAARNSMKSGKASYKQLVELTRNIGEESFKVGNPNRLPIDVEKSRELYFALNDALVGTVDDTLGKQIARGLVENNKAMSEFIGHKNIVSKVINAPGASPESVFRNLVGNVDSTKLEALKKVFGKDPELMEQFKGAFVENLIKRDAEGAVLFDSTMKNLKQKKHLISQVLSPDEIQDLDEILNIGHRFGRPIMSTSGTGASNAFRDLNNTVTNQIFNDTVIESMKKRARGLTTPSDALSLALPPVQSGPGLVPPGTGPLRLPQRTRLDNTLKALQVESTLERPKK